MTFRLLFVEDDKAQLALFQDALSEWNADHVEQQFDLTVETEFNSALEQLDRTRFHAALLDLRLPGGDGKLAGSQLAEACIRTYGIPGAIISGHPKDFDQKAIGKGLMAVFDKGDADCYEKAISWFAAQWQMLDVLAQTRKKIQSMGASVFAERVWPRWKSYQSLAGLDQEQLVSIVSRQYASHIGDLLGLETEGNVKWHPFENYVQPSIQESRPHTGDIFRLDDQFWIVLTPQCDMATGKANTVLMAHCNLGFLAEMWQKAIEDSKGSNTAKDKSRSFFTRLVNQAEPSAHFLPPLDGTPLWVDFKTLTTVPLSELREKLSVRVASVAAPFLTNLTQRFGAYISRVGQPNIDITHFQ